MTLCPLSCTSQKVNNSTISSLDSGRYLGRWYEIARFDHSFERGMEFTTAMYTLKDNGTIQVINSGMKDGKSKSSTGKAKFTGTPGLLRVSFFGPFYSDYRVMMLSPDYQYALIGSGSSKYLWILSRTPQVPEDVLQKILEEARSRGYDTGKLIWVKQHTQLFK